MQTRRPAGKANNGSMVSFLGTHQNRLDAKGRVSVPAPFRAALRARDETNGTHLVLRPSHQHPCIEAWPSAEFEALSEPLNRLDLFSQAHDDLAASLYSDAFPVEADKEGRIVLPESLVTYAGLAETVVFMGLGRIFQIWEPAAAERRRAEARERARVHGFTLPGNGAAMSASHATPMSPSCCPRSSRLLAPRDGGVYLDGTFGGGGYATAFLEAAPCTVWAIDRDPEAIARGASLAARFPGRLHLIHGRFGDMLDLLAERGVTALDGVVLDLGVSSFQLDDPARGFSFRGDGPLDMRMGRSGPTAADLVNTLPERELADLLFEFGEERASRRIARAIVAARAEAPIATTARSPPSSAACCRRTAPASIPRPAASRRCASG